MGNLEVLEGGVSFHACSLKKLKIFVFSRFLMYTHSYWLWLIGIIIFQSCREQRSLIKFIFNEKKSRFSQKLVFWPNVGFRLENIGVLAPAAQQLWPRGTARLPPRPSPLRGGGQNPDIFQSKTHIRWNHPFSRKSHFIRQKKTIYRSTETPLSLWHKILL